MNNSDYWRRRFEILEDSQNRNAAQAIEDLEREFNRAQREIEEQVRVWYSRFADNNQISISDAQKWLSGRDLAEFKWDVNEYIKYGKENALNQQWTKQLENASSRFHVSRLEALKVQTQNTMEKLFGNQVDVIDNLMKETYLDGYYKTLFEVQKGFGVGWDIAGINESQLQKILSRPWTVDGDTFSDRIWFQKDKLISEVHTQLMQNMILGRSPDASIKAIATKFNTSKSNAGRLIMTESAYFASEAEKHAYSELDVSEYEILATLDRSTCATCGAFDGMVAPVAQFSAGITAPPFHPWCRCTTVPHFDDDLGERAARNLETGETTYVPSDMKYPEWKKQFVNEPALPLPVASQATNAINTGQSAGSSGIIGVDPIEQMLNTKKGVPIDEYRAVVGTNPNYNKGYEYQVNCQRCVPAYELRRRGYDVTAKPRPRNNSINTSVDSFNAVLTDTTGKADLLQQLSTFPDGARFGVRQNWKGYSGAGHTYTAVKENGKLYFFDPQNGSLDCSSYLDQVSKRRGKSTLKYFRMDNVDFKSGLDLNDIVEVRKP